MYLINCFKIFLKKKKNAEEEKKKADEEKKKAEEEKKKAEEEKKKANEENNESESNESSDSDSDESDIEISNDERNNFLKPITREYEFYFNLSAFYNIAIDKNLNKKQKVQKIKDFIHKYVVGSVELTKYTSYIKSKNTNLINKYLNSKTFRAKINYYLNNLPIDINKIDEKSLEGIKNKKTKTKLKKNKKKINLSIKKYKNNKKKIYLESEQINKILKKAPKLRQSLIVFKKIDSNVSKQFVENEYFIDRNISIYQYNPLENLSLKNITLKLKLPKGTRCLVVCPNNSMIYKDCEILVPKDNKFLVKKIRKISTENIKNHTIIELELIK